MDPDRPPPKAAIVSLHGKQYDLKNPAERREYLARKVKKIPKKEG